MSRQQDIIDALKTLLGTIRKAAGYNTDLGTSVKEWEFSESEDDLPYTDVRDDDDIPISVDGGFVYRMPLSIAVLTKGDTSREEARKMAYDVYKAIGSTPTLGGKADKISPVRHRLNSGLGSSVCSGVLITVMVTFSTAPWQDE
jgi:hypothetical protein